MGGKFDLAEKWISDSFKSTAQTGDIVLESRRLTYLTVIHRRRGKVETARCYAERGLSSAASVRMIEYVGMAKGNRAWVNLRDGDAAARSRRHDRINGAAATSVWRSTVVSGAGDAAGIALVQVYAMGFENDNSLGNFKGLASTHGAGPLLLLT